MDALLKDLLPYKVRLWVYFIIGLSAMGFSAYHAADGNWLEAAAGFIATLSNLLAAGNVDTGEEV